MLCAAAYQQCGGMGWAGPTCCQPGCKCSGSGGYYSQCTPPIGSSTGTCSPASLAPLEGITSNAPAPINVQPLAPKLPSRAPAPAPAPTPAPTPAATPAPTPAP